MHYFSSSRNRHFETPAGYAGHSSKYGQAVLVSAPMGAVHSHVTLNDLQPDGYIGLHMHSFEEGCYVLDGEALVAVGDETLRLAAGDFIVFKAGTLHGWRSVGATAARWLQIAAPIPKASGPVRDTFFAARPATPSGSGVPVAAGGYRALAGHFDATQIPPPGAARAELSTLPGVFLRWIIDEAFGARHHRMLFIEYQPTVGIAPHDHTFEETYFILSGEIEATLDGDRYVARPGDVIWTAVGCVHSFANRSSEPVRWLETFAPQPPAENVFRFVEEWETRGRSIENT